MFRPDRPARRWPHRLATLPLMVMIAGTLATDPPAYACDCPEPDPPAQAAEEAAAVFSGEVVATTTRGDEPPEADLVAEVEVEDVWAGDVHERVEVSTPADQGLCGTDLEVGTTYLLYLRHDGDGDLVTDLCMRTTALDRADEDLTALGEPDEPDERLAGDDTEAEPGGAEDPSEASGVSRATIATSTIVVLGLAVFAVWWWRRRRHRFFR